MLLTLETVLTAVKVELDESKLDEVLQLKLNMTLRPKNVVWLKASKG